MDDFLRDRPHSFSLTIPEERAARIIFPYVTHFHYYYNKALHYKFSVIGEKTCVHAIQIPAMRNVCFGQFRRAGKCAEAGYKPWIQKLGILRPDPAMFLTIPPSRHFPQTSSYIIQQIHILVSRVWLTYIQTVIFLGKN